MPLLAASKLACVRMVSGNRHTAHVTADATMVLLNPLRILVHLPTPLHPPLLALKLETVAPPALARLIVTVIPTVDAQQHLSPTGTND